MARDLISLLENDHDKLRSLKDEIRFVLNRDGEHVDEATINERIRDLHALLTAHSRGEELSLYSLFKDASSKRMNELRPFAREGFEDHAFMEMLLTELEHAHHIDRDWAVRFNSFSALLEDHLFQEEDEFFPKVRALLGNFEISSMANVYMKKRNQILTTSGTKWPASVEKPSGAFSM